MSALWWDSFYPLGLEGLITQERGRPEQISVRNSELSKVMPLVPVTWMARPRASNECPVLAEAEISVL